MMTLPPQQPGWNQGSLRPQHEAQRLNVGEQQRITEVEELLADFDNAPQDAMTPLSYAHAYTELELAVRDLIDIIHHHTDP
jgi:hypothetical protein